MRQNPITLPLCNKFERDGYCFCEAPNYRNAVIFCITARVGSTALMSSFAKLIGAKHLPEIFNPRYRFAKLQKKYQASSIQEYVNKYFSENMSGKDVVFKTNYNDMFGAVNKENFPILFPRVKFVYIYRNDMVAQAYSLWKATKYQVWHSTKGKSRATQPEIAVEPEDRLRILKFMTNLYRERCQWEHFFRSTGAEVSSIAFEEIVRDLPGTVRRAYRFSFGTPLPDMDAPTDHVRTSTDRDTENIRGMKEYIRGL